MSIETGNPQPHGYDFNAIEAAVKETERGRWFLAEYDRRSRTADTHALLDAIGKLENIIRAVPLERRGSECRLELADAIRNTKAEIEAVQNSPFPEATLSPSPRGSTFGHLTVQAKSIAAELSQLCEVMQLTSESLRDDPEGMAGAMAHVTQRLLDIDSLQDVLAKRIAKAADLLSFLDREMNGEGDRSADIAARLVKLAADAPRPTFMLSEENLKYFCKDQELFSDETQKPSQPLPASSPSECSALASPPAVETLSEPKQPASEPGAKARIVIVRTPSSAAQPIPLADDAPDSAPQSAA